MTTIRIIFILGAVMLVLGTAFRVCAIGVREGWWAL